MITKNYLFRRIIDVEDVQYDILDKIDELQTIVSYLDDEIKKLQKPEKKPVKKTAKKVSKAKK